MAGNVPTRAGSTASGCFEVPTERSTCAAAGGPAAFRQPEATQIKAAKMSADRINFLPRAKGCPEWPVENVQNKDQRFPAANVAPSFTPFRRGGLLKTCRIKTKDFPPQTLCQVSPPLEGGARVGLLKTRDSRSGSFPPVVLRQASPP